MAASASIDLRDPKTFRGATLTSDQFQERYQILQDLEETKVDRGEQLRPRSQKELAQAAELYGRMQIEALDKPQPICRFSTAHYWVRDVSKESPVAIYKKLDTQIIQIPQTQAGILKAIVQAAKNDWFQGAIAIHSDEVLGGRFMGTLRNTFIANMCILRASALLVIEPKLFSEVSSLFEESNALHNIQMTYNERIELKLIESAEGSYSRMRNFHGQILSICGSTLENKKELVVAANECRKKEATALIEKYYDCDDFIQVIEDLDLKAQTCIQNITNKNVQVRDAISHLQALLKQQEVLNNKKQQIQHEFDVYQEALRKEVESKKVITEKLSVTFFGIPLWDTTNTFLKQEDFHSKEACARYQEAQHEGDKLKKELDQAKDMLAASMIANGVMQYKDQKGLEEATAALSTAIFCVGQLRIALMDRKEHAKQQIAVYDHLLRTPREEEMKSMEEIFDFLEVGIQRILKQQALWLGNHRHTLTLQKCQEMEQGMRLKMIGALAKSGSDPQALASLEAELNKYVPKISNEHELEELLQIRLVSNEEMYKAIKMEVKN